MKTIKLSETKYSFDVASNLRIAIDKDTSLIISSAEIMEAAKSIVTHTQRKHKIPESVIKTIEKDFEASRKKPGRKKGSKKVTTAIKKKAPAKKKIQTRKEKKKRGPGRPRKDKNLF